MRADPWNAPSSTREIRLADRRREGATSLLRDGGRGRRRRRPPLDRCPDREPLDTEPPGLSPAAREETERGEEEGSGGTAARDEPHPRCPGHWAEGGRPWSRPLSDAASLMHRRRSRGAQGGFLQARCQYDAWGTPIVTLEEILSACFLVCVCRRYNDPSLLSWIALDQLASAANILGR
ncbi:uncharacterized protein LOC125946419 [Dermacentor silvarum]|uniref:uncharacterized protein LOC125946419 n=1 Tax=Dermacentor silvarum TaxID=543639 RepID=UPI002100E6F2|nr:uncharacterized protein LOC125946419 [Dermacentor silvarum]